MSSVGFGIPYRNLQSYETGLVHSKGDVGALMRSIKRLREVVLCWEKLGSASLELAPGVTRAADGRILLDVYLETVAGHRARASCETSRDGETICAKA